MAWLSRAAVVVGILAIATLVRSDAAREKLIDFEGVGADVDDAPSGFSAVMTGGGDSKGWKVEEGTPPLNGTGARRQLVRHSTDASENRAPVCVYDDVTTKDVDVTVFFKATSGTFEQSAGLAVRFQDVDNYYVLRANAKVGNVALLKVTAGKIEKIEDRSSGVTLKKWQKLRLVVRGDAFEAFLDDVSLFTAKDGAISKDGKVGLWTKSDSEAAFDDLRIVSN